MLAANICGEILSAQTNMNEMNAITKSAVRAAQAMKEKLFLIHRHTLGSRPACLWYTIVGNPAVVTAIGIERVSLWISFEGKRVLLQY